MDLCHGPLSMSSKMLRKVLACHGHRVWGAYLLEWEEDLLRLPHDEHATRSSGLSLTQDPVSARQETPTHLDSGLMSKGVSQPKHHGD